MKWLLVMVLGCLPLLASASTLSFGFSPIALSGPLSGAVELNLTVQQAGATGFSENYFNTDIVAMQAIVGSQTLSLNSTSHTTTPSASAVYITTDAAGLPTLDLSALIDSSRGFTSFETLGGMQIQNIIQLGTGNGAGTDFPALFIAIGGLWGVNNTANFTLAGTVVVPLPGALGLFFSALGGIGWVRRQRLLGR